MMSISLRILEEETYSASMSGLETDCPLWPYLLNFTREARHEWREDADQAEQTERKIILNAFLSNLIQRLMSVANNVLVAECDVLEASTGLKGIERSAFYACVRENNGYLIDILSAYPELDRLLCTMTDRFIINLQEFSRCYSSDRALLIDCLSCEPGSILQHCTVSEGETHNGGKTVVVLTFEDDKKIVFKPRNLEMEDTVSTLLRQLGQKAGLPFSDWVIPTYWPRGDYGWVQYTGQQSVHQRSDAEIFYIRMGFLLGFCTSVTASDMTSDNVIAHGAHPIPVDFETVFYSVLTQKNIPREVRWNASLTSILPNWTWKGSDGIGVDLSAIGGLTEQYVSLNLYQYIAREDRDSFGLDGVKIMPNENVLYLHDEAVKPWQFDEAILRGFEQYFELVRADPATLVKAIQSCRGLPVRYVPRATATYHYAVQCSFHPTLMTSTVARRDFLQDILSTDTPPAVGFLASEIAACMDNDIPYAKAKAGELVFEEPYYGGQGALEADCFQDGIAHSIDYIKTFTNQRLSFEKKLIVNSLVAMRSMYDYGHALTENTFRPNDSLNNLDEYDLHYVREKLRQSFAANSAFTSTGIKEALEDNGLWLGFHASSGGYMEYSELGEDFYYGLTGILYGCVVANHFSSFAAGVIQPLKEMCYERVMGKFENPGTQLGGFHFGLASTVTPLYLSLEALGDERAPGLLDAFKGYLGNVLEDDLWQKYFMGCDLMSGVSGCLALLTTLHELTADPCWITLADDLFEKGCSGWVDENGQVGLCFDKAITVREDGLLSGLSHGVIGCAYALYYYNFNMRKSAEVERLADTLLAWEIKHFDEGIANWPDYRVRSQTEAGEFGWSHGMPGNLLVLSYLSDHGVARARAFLESHPIEQYLTFESLSTRKRPVNDSMCHGALGLLNIIKQISPTAALDHRLYFWANVINFCEQDTRDLRVRTADPFGLWVGKVGSVLGVLGLLDDQYQFPFLPHQMKCLR